MKTANIISILTVNGIKPSSFTCKRIHHEFIDIIVVAIYEIGFFQRREIREFAIREEADGFVEISQMKIG
jgi:hypothetical protein